jgi:hypothetical protein
MKHLREFEKNLFSSGHVFEVLLVGRALDHGVVDPRLSGQLLQVLDRRLHPLHSQKSGLEKTSPAFTSVTIGVEKNVTVFYYSYCM